MHLHSQSNISHLYPSRLDWKIWSELVSILEPIQAISDFLSSPSESHLSLLWYIIDWVVCIYHQSSKWDVYSVIDKSVVMIPTTSLCPPVSMFMSNLIRLLRKFYLSDSLKRTQPELYQYLCIATYVDPRTKNFHFFRDVEVLSADYHTLYHRDAKSYVLNEIRNEICSLLETYLSESHHTAAYRALMKCENSAVRSVLDGILKMISFDSCVEGSLHSSLDTDDFGLSSTSSLENTQECVFSGVLFDLLQDRVKSSQLRECIDEYCRVELLRYENEPMFCLPNQIRDSKPCDYWSKNHVTYPILSRVARRFMSLKMDLGRCSSNKLRDLTVRIYGKNRKPMCPILFDAIIFLHMNSGSLPRQMY